jgi:hypothetical protein
MSEKINAQSMDWGVDFLSKHIIIDELREGIVVAQQCEILCRPEFIYIAWHKDMFGQVLSWFVGKLQAINGSIIFAHDLSQGVNNNRGHQPDGSLMSLAVNH